MLNGKYTGAPSIKPLIKFHVQRIRICIHHTPSAPQPQGPFHISLISPCSLTSHCKFRESGIREKSSAGQYASWYIMDLQRVVPHVSASQGTVAGVMPPWGGMLSVYPRERRVRWVLYQIVQCATINPVPLSSTGGRCSTCSTCAMRSFRPKWPWLPPKTLYQHEKDRRFV